MRLVEEVEKVLDLWDVQSDKLEPMLGELDEVRILIASRIRAVTEELQFEMERSQ